MPSAKVAGWEAMSDPSESFISGAAGAAALNGGGSSDSKGSGWNPISTILDLFHHKTLPAGSSGAPASAPTQSSVPLVNGPQLGGSDEGPNTLDLSTLIQGFKLGA